MKKRREKTYGVVGITKGTRAKRGRRRDYKEVYLACGIIDDREAAALEGLLSICQNPKQDNASVEIPESEVLGFTIGSVSTGLRSSAEALVSFVASSTPVAFWLPQVAEILRIELKKMNFVVEVLCAVGVMTLNETGTYVWQGREIKQPIRNGDAFEAGNCEFNVLCLEILEILKITEGPMASESIGRELIKRGRDTKNVSISLRSILEVLLGAGLLLPVRYPNGEHYVIRCEQMQQRDTSTDRPIPNGYTTSLPLVLNDDTLTKTIVESVHRLRTTTASPSYLQAAVMEINGKEISQVGVVDILGHGSLQSNDQTNAVIALAVPPWMLNRRSADQQEKFGRSPVYMSYVPIANSSLIEALRRAVHGPKTFLTQSDPRHCQSYSLHLKQL